MPKPILKVSVTDTSSPTAIDKPVPPTSATDTTIKKKLLPVSLPTRKSARGLIPKTLNAIDTGASSADLKYVDELMAAFLCLAFKAASLYYEPKSFIEAMTGPEKEFWKPAADIEIDNRTRNNSWTLVPLPPGAVCIPSGWDYKVKTDKFGLPSQRKNRFFEKGYQ